ncbi:hypothetical protein NQ318_009508, partial [Aromia moschata]
NLYIRLGETFRPKSNHGTAKTITVDEKDEILIRVSENPRLSTRRLIVQSTSESRHFTSYCFKICQLAYNLLSFYKICKPNSQIFLRFYLPMGRHVLDAQFLIRADCELLMEESFVGFRGFTCCKRHFQHEF